MIAQTMLLKANQCPPEGYAMLRRLNFLLPNAELAQKVVHELTNMGVSNKNIHTYAEHNWPIGSLNPATKNQTNDKAQHLENTLWKNNLVLFFLFLSISLIAFITQHFLIAFFSIGVMLISFTAGYFFTTHIPHTHLGKFKHALSHNELLVMVDVPNKKLGIVEDKIHRHHPAAFECGSSWAIKGADI